MKFFTTIFIVFVLTVVGDLKAIVLSDFGTGQFTQTFSDFSTNSQSSTTFTIGGVDSNSIYGNIAPSSPINIAGNTSSLLLTATFTGTAATNFQIDLFDSLGNDRLYQANFSSFTQGVEGTLTLSFVTQTGSFNNNVVSFGLLTAGTGLGSVNLVMNQLQAVPEPSTYALLAMGALVIGGVSLKRKAAKI